MGVEYGQQGLIVTSSKHNLLQPGCTRPSYVISRPSENVAFLFFVSSPVAAVQKPFISKLCHVIIVYCMQVE